MPRTVVFGTSTGALTVAALTLVAIPAYASRAVLIPTDVALATGLPVGSRLLGVH
jgi:hypothetical protein